MELFGSESRKALVLALVALVLGVAVPAQLHRPVAGSWIELGDSHVDGHSDHDKIKVHDRGPFRALRLRVRGSAVEFDHLLVHFENGEMQNLRASFVVKDGSSSPSINLTGNQRNVESVELWYRRGSWSDKPQVLLFGRR
jgi:hypothetical protein